MKNLIIIVFSINLLLFSGCAQMQNGVEYKSGVVDYRLVDENSKKTTVKFFDYNSTNSYFDSDNDEYIDIRLSNIMFNTLFDFTFSKNKNKKVNNIGVFVTIREINSESNLTDALYTYPNKALVYTDNVYVNAKANQSFTPIYLSKYHGGDLQIELKVVEFDSKNKNFMPLLNSIVSLSQNAISSSFIGQTATKIGQNYLGLTDLNKLGSSLLDTFYQSHNDLITSYKLNLISPKSVKNKDLHKLPYLKEGDIVFVRLEEGDVNNKTSNWKNFKYNSKEKVIEDVYKNVENVEKRFKKHYSYIVLTIIKRKFQKKE